MLLKKNTKRNYTYLGIFLIGISFLFLSCSKEDSQLDKLPDEGGGIEYYVSPYGAGAMNGDSKENAADFLNDSFWSKVRNSVRGRDVTVYFLKGEYGRSYSENKKLELLNIGNPEHRLLIKGGEGVIWTFTEGLSSHAKMAIDVRGSENIIIDGFHFTGNGEASWGVRFYKLNENTTKLTKNITLQNSTFTDMEGLYYGAIGILANETSHINIKDNILKRVGVNSHAHFIYNSEGATHTSVINNHFEDCTGDYVRFKDVCEYAYANGNKFIKNLERFSGHGFISIPVFNSVDPGEELFGTNYAFINNEFINNTNYVEENAIRYLHWGYDPAGWNYNLTAEEGIILESGTVQERKSLLLQNFGIDVDKIRVYNNTYSASSHLKRKVGFITDPRHYGASSKGYYGNVDITDIVNHQSEPFDWEP